MTNCFIWFDLKFAAVLEVLTVFLCCAMTVVMMWNIFNRWVGLGYKNWTHGHVCGHAGPSRDDRIRGGEVSYSVPRDN